MARSPERSPGTLRPTSWQSERRHARRRNRQPDPQLALPRAHPPLPLRRRGDDQRGRRGATRERVLHADSGGEEALADPVRHGVDTRPDRGEPLHQPRPRQVDLWRRGGWQGVTPTTRRLLEHWTDPDPDPERQRRLFFCRSRPSRRLSTSPRRPRSSTTPGSPTSCASSPTTQPGSPENRSQDGHRDRQDGGHGDADRLADAQQEREPGTRASPTPS